MILEVKIILIALTILAIAGVVGLIVGLATGKQELCLKIAKAIKAKIVQFYNDVIKFPIYIITHPVQGFNEFKVEKKGKMYAALSILAFYILVQILTPNYEGGTTNVANPMNFNSLKIVVFGVVPVILIAVANWSITSLFDGKGKMKEIFMMICYCYFPLAVCGLLRLIVSNFVTSDEVLFLTIIDIVGLFGTGYMLFMGLVVIHEYGVFKTIISVIGTVVAILIILFLALLIFDLANQVFSFFSSIFKEIMVRFMS